MAGYYIEYYTPPDARAGLGKGPSRSPVVNTLKGFTSWVSGGEKWADVARPKAGTMHNSK